MIAAPSLKYIQEYLCNQNVALIGNAESVLKGCNEIDGYDKIIRLNKGSPRQHEGILGRRTDVLGLAIDLKHEEIASEFNPEILIWLSMPSLKKYKKPTTRFPEWQTTLQGMKKSPGLKKSKRIKDQETKPRCRLNSFIRETAYQTGMSMWNECENNLGYRPSTGCLMVHFLVKNIKFKSLTLLGFDWWKTPTWYYRSGPGPHNPAAEENYIVSLQKTSRLTIIK